MVNKAVDPGLLQVLEDDIVPRLEQYLPCQPKLFTKEEAPRFTLVFDREGYSPRFIRKMLQKGIACLSYHKYPDEVVLRKYSYLLKGLTFFDAAAMLKS